MCASPQLENGYVKIANEIMDALISANLSGQQLKALLFVIRKTYGFNKKEDYISLTQFAKNLGTSKTRASQVVGSLGLMKTLTVTENLNGLTKKYLFNKDFDQWTIPLRKTLTVKVKRKNRIGLAKETVKENINHKIQYTKDNTTKDIITPKRVLSDKDFLTALKENPAYKGIDVDRELGRMDAWLLTPKGHGRKKTKRFIVNWLNKIDVPLQEEKKPIDRGEFMCKKCSASGQQVWHRYSEGCPKCR